MSGTKIDVAAVKASANRMSEINSSVKSIVDRIQGDIENINSFWSGEASASFVSTLHGMVEEAQSLSKTSQEMSSALSDTAQKYAAADQA